ncbi:MAG TPA: cytochrome c, partial [Bacteroidia bacterium]|nr:cytochrome c [Bacteroidia bacterium]
TCHQPNGLGMANIYPPLAGSPWVTGSVERLAKVTLHGLWGPMEVNGTVYDPAKGVPPMTAFKAILSDKEIAAVLTFVRNTWGNEAPVVTPEQVKAVREATKDVQMFLKPEDLLGD